MIHGRRDWSGGVTLLKRVTGNHAAALEKCDGYDPHRGELAPDKVVKNITETPLSGTITEQLPISYVDNGTKYVIARDSEEKIREFGVQSGQWSNAKGKCEIVPHSKAARFKDQAIFSTDGARAKLMCYERNSPSTKLRPLSFKSPADYSYETRPNITIGDNEAVALWDLTVNTWSSSQSGNVTVDNDTSSGETTITIKSTATLDAFASITLSSALPLAGKRYMCIDIAVNDDPQLYEYTGLFANNANLYPSGYILVFQDSNNSVIKSFYLPQITPANNINRVMISLGDNDNKSVKKIILKPTTFWKAPQQGQTYRVHLYGKGSSNAWKDDWTHNGTYLFPNIKYELSPLAKIILEGESVTSNLALPIAANVIPNGNFNLIQGQGFIGWTISSIWATVSGVSRSGSALRLGGNSATAVMNDYVDIDDSKEYTFELWHYNHDKSYTCQLKFYWKMNSGPNKYGYIGSKGYQEASTSYNFPQAQEWKKISFKVKPPANARKFKFSFSGKRDDSNCTYDDLMLYIPEVAPVGKVWILDKYARGSKPQVKYIGQYCYTFMGRDILGSELYSNMFSNPSDVSAPDIFLDPFRVYNVNIDFRYGPVNQLTLTNQGSGYSANTYHKLFGSSDTAYIKVLTVDSSGKILTYELAKEGEGYKEGTVKVGTAETGAAEGTVTVITPFDEYGDYLTGIVLYRRFYNKDLNVWEPWTLINVLPFEGDEIRDEKQCSILDNGLVAPQFTFDAPYYLDPVNDYASSAKYIIVADNRIYAAGLDWDNIAKRWRRPLSLEVSTMNEIWAFPATTDDTSQITSGSELELPTETGSEIRGLLSRNEDKYVWTENEFFILRGDNPLEGWQFIKLDSIGLISNKTAADCRKMFIWHNGDNFYAYAGGKAEPISRFAIDSSLIDWSKPHAAVYCKEKYILHCYYGNMWALIIYDLDGGFWRIRQSPALDFVGICSDGETVYGLTPAGRIVDVFGSTTNDYGAQNTVREISTQYVILAQPGEDVHVSDAIIEALTDEPNGVQLELSFYTHGLRSERLNPVQSQTITVYPNQTRYRVGLNVQCDAVKTQIKYTGTKPPTIFFVGVLTSESYTSEVTAR